MSGGQSAMFNIFKRSKFVVIAHSCFKRLSFVNLRFLTTFIDLKVTLVSILVFKPTSKLHLSSTRFKVQLFKHLTLTLP